MSAAYVGPRYTTTISMDITTERKPKRFGLFGNKAGSDLNHTHAPSKFHLRMQKSMNVAKQTFKKAAALTPGHEQRVARRNNLGRNLIETTVLRSTLRDEKKKARAAEKASEVLKAELEDEKEAKVTLQADLRDAKNRTIDQEEQLREITIDNKVHELRLELEMKSFAMSKADIMQDINKQKAEYEEQLELKKTQLTTLQSEVLGLHQNLHDAGSKVATVESQAAETIEALENNVKQVEIEAEQHLASEKDRFERENSNLTWHLHQAKKDFESERAHVCSLIDEYQLLEANKQDFEKENSALLAERDTLQQDLKDATKKIDETKNDVSAAIARMYQYNPILKKDPESTPLAEALADYIELGTKKINAAAGLQRDAEAFATAEKGKYRSLVDKTAEQRKEYLAMKKEIGDCNGARIRAEYDFVQQGSKLAAVYQHNKDLEQQLKEANQLAAATEQKNKQLEHDLAEAKKIVDASAQNVNNTNSVNDAYTKIAELEKRCNQLNQDKADLEDQLETEECITADKIASMQQKLDEAQGMLETERYLRQEDQSALENMNIWLTELNSEKNRSHVKVVDAVNRCNIAIKRQLQAESDLDEVVVEKSILQELVDGTQISFEAHVTQLSQDFEEKLSDLRYAYNLAQNGMDSDNMSDVHEGLFGLRDILGRSEEIEASEEDVDGPTEESSEDDTSNEEVDETGELSTEALDENTIDEEDSDDAQDSDDELDEEDSDTSSIGEVHEVGVAYYSDEELQQLRSMLGTPDQASFEESLLARNAESEADTDDH